MIEQELRLLQNVVPAHLHSAAFVAGGAAIAPQSAADIDVWLFDPTAHGIRYNGLQAQLTRNLTQHGRPVGKYTGFQPYPENVGDVRNPGGYTDEEWAKYQLAINSDWLDLDMRVLLGYTPLAGAGKPIQFLVVRKPHTHIIDLLERFDISSQQWAIGLEGSWPWSLGFSSTLPCQLPRVKRWTTPQSTLTRLHKLCERYGWDIREHPDLPRLTQLAETARMESSTSLVPGQFTFGFRGFPITSDAGTPF